MNNPFSILILIGNNQNFWMLVKLRSIKSLFLNIDLDPVAKIIHQEMLKEINNNTAKQFKIVDLPKVQELCINIQLNHKNISIEKNHY